MTTFLLYLPPHDRPYALLTILYAIAACASSEGLNVRNRQTGQSRLLLNKPALICHFYTRNDEKGPVRGSYLLFGIADTDSNRDGLINSADAVRLYRTDVNGSGLTPITPEATLLMTVDGVADQLYIRLARDTDGDSKFTSKDVIQVVRVDTKTWASPQLVIPDALRQQAFDAAAAPLSQP